MKRTGSGFYVCADTERKTLRLHDMLPTRLRAASRDLLEQADGKSACIFFRNFSRRFPKVRRYRCGSASAEKSENCRKQWDQKSGLTGIIASSYGLDILTARSFTATGQGGFSDVFIHVAVCPEGKIRFGRL